MKLNTTALRAALAQPKTAMHCDTEEKAVALFEAMGWSYRESYWNTHEKATCFNTRGDGRLDGYSPAEYYRDEEGYTILTLDDYILPDKPRLAEVLGVEVGQEFRFGVDGHGGIIYRIDASGRRWANGYGSCENEMTLTAMINNPHLIHPLPRWTEGDIADAKAVMRILDDAKWIAREKNGETRVFSDEPARDEDGFCNKGRMRLLAATTFPSVTWENSPVKLEEIK